MNHPVHTRDDLSPHLFLGVIAPLFASLIVVVVQLHDVLLGGGCRVHGRVLLLFVWGPIQ